jgi:dimethylargininase
MIRKFTTAIVRVPCPEMVNGITTAGLGVPEYRLALNQHRHYVEVLESLGLRVVVMESDRQYPDSVFVEDVALCTPTFAIITNPGAASRNGEQISIREVLAGFYESVEVIKSPGTLEAGDVMMVDAHFFIGISDRTNQEGARQAIEILKSNGYSASMVPLKDVLHLKTGVSYLENNTLLVSGEFTDSVEFIEFRRIVVPKHEAYAANSLWINGTVLVPEGFPETLAKIKNAGYLVKEIRVSEFQKLDGGLSCLSLRF